MIRAQWYTGKRQKAVEGIVRMRKIIALLFALCLALTLTGCSGVKEEDAPIRDADLKVLVAYFSCTGNTGRVAEQIAETLGADAFEIVPETPYTNADLDANEPSGRAMTEQNDEDARPAMVGTVENMEDYDVVFLGYPIWWGEAPRILCTFLEGYDFTGKTIIPFCTSSNTGIGDSAKHVQRYASGSPRWQEGVRFPSSVARRTVEEWIDELHLK